MNSQQIAQVFQPGGALSRIKGYEYRPQQVTLATTIREAQGHVMAEAATGSGKSLAYLVPIVDKAIQNKTVALVATSTVALQEQLLNDAATLKRLLFPKLKVALLKGRSHYLCPTRLKGALKDDHTRERWQSLYAIEKAHKKGKIERSQMTPLALKAWDIVDASICTENNKCSKCPLRDAREMAAKAHLVITSHAMLIHDGARRSILPEFADIVIDEAHKLEDATTDQQSVSIPFVNDPKPLTDLIVIGITTSMGTEVLPYLQAAMNQVQDPDKVGNGRIPPTPAWGTLCDAFNQHMIPRLEGLDRQVQSFEPVDDKQLIAQMKCQWDLQHYIRNLQLFFRVDPSYVRWVENAHMKSAPLEVGCWLHRNIWEGARPVLVSATLRKLNEFDRDSLGLDEGPELVLDSPFDYQSQCLLILPDSLDPDHAGYPDQVAKCLRDLHDTLGGSVMCLFTSWSAMRAVDKRLRDHLPLLTQGIDGERTQLINQFRAGGTVLLGTATFWEGIDMVGDTLRGLVIARLPFDVPTDPLHKARADLMENPFIDYTLARTSLKLRQGFGRLVRSRTDTGVVVIMDPRLRTRRYGHQLLGTLPKCTIYEGNDIQGMTRAWFQRKPKVA